MRSRRREIRFYPPVPGLFTMGLKDSRMQIEATN